jgi:hypothetical protein
MTIYPALSKIGSGLSRNLAGSDFIAAIRAARKDKFGVLADAGPGGMKNILVIGCCSVFTSSNAIRQVVVVDDI